MKLSGPAFDPLQEANRMQLHELLLATCLHEIIVELFEHELPEGCPCARAGASRFRICCLSHTSQVLVSGLRALIVSSMPSSGGSSFFPYSSLACSSAGRETPRQLTRLVATALRSRPK